MSRTRHFGRLVTSWQHGGSKYSTATKTPQTVTILPESTLATFRTRAFQKKVPALLPRGHFDTLPAIHKWFSKSGEHGIDDARLDNYLDKFGDAIVPLEITDDGRFVQVQETLQFFIKYVSCHKRRFLEKNKSTSVLTISSVLRQQQISKLVYT